MKLFPQYLDPKEVIGTDIQCLILVSNRLEYASIKVLQICVLTLIQKKANLGKPG